MTHYCPISCLEIIYQKDWINKLCSDSFQVSFYLIGDSIIYCKPKGRADLEGVQNSIKLKAKIVSQLSNEERSYIQIQDYSELKGSSLSGRKFFIHNANKDSNLKGMIFCNLSTPLNIAVKLGNRFNTKNKIIHIERTYKEAIKKALELTGQPKNKNKVFGVHINDFYEEHDFTLNPIKIFTKNRWNIKIPDFSNEAIIINDSILHSTTIGSLKSDFIPMLTHMRNECRLSLPSESSLDYIVVNGEKLTGSTRTARFKFMQSLKDWHSKFPFRMYISYNVNTFTSTAFQIANTLMPFKVKVANDFKHAMCLIKNDQINAPVIKKKTGANKINEKDIEKLLSIIGNLNWKNKGFDDSLNISHDHPFHYLYQSIKLIKEEFDGVLTEREQNELALKGSEKKYRGMLEAMTDPLYICSPEKKISYMNPAMVNRIGRNATGESCHKILHNLDEPCNWCIFDKIIEGETNEITIVSPLDNRTYRITNMPVEIDKNVSKMSIYKDITDYLNAISEKEQVQAKLVQAQKMESIGQLAGGIAHDFNNILYPIIGFTQLSQNELPQDHPVQENMTDILDGAKRASNLVKRILHFSRQKKPELKPIILQPVIKETQKLLRSTIPSNIDLHLNLYDNQDTVMCDESEIHEIILNLCTNAYHAIAGDQGLISINLYKQNPPNDLDLSIGDYLCLSVKDNGVGIPEKIKDKIFEPYVTTKEVGKGSGLGLSVVYGIVKNYKGGIRVESSPKTGTEFNIYLPITNQTPDVEKSTSIEDSDTHGNEHILFVDDEDSIVKLGVRALRNSGYRVTGINNGAKALKVFKSNPDDFNLVITDMAMPGIVGSELAKKILDIRLDVPIIICSGYSEKLDRMKAQELKVSAFLDKPLDINNLIKNIRRILDKKIRMN